MEIDVRLAFQNLPAGVYTYELRATELLATGLLQYDMGLSVLTTEYNRDITYVEYDR